MSRSGRIGLVVLLVAGAGLAIVTWPSIEAFVGVLLDRDRVLAWLSGFGAWAPLAFIAFSFILPACLSPRWPAWFFLRSYFGSIRRPSKRG